MADAKQAGGAAHAHAGHRQRMRGKVFSGGMDSMPPHELIEFLLFYAIPKRDVNALAHALLNEFGSLERLFTADESELRRVPGIGSGAAKLIVAYGAAMRQYLDSRAVSTDWTFSVPGAIETANAHFVHPTRQEMAALFMNPDGGLLCCAVRDWDIIRDPEGVRWLVGQAIDVGAHQVALVWRRYARSRHLTRAELEALNGLVSVLSGAEIGLTDVILLYRDGAISLRDTGRLVDPAGSEALAMACGDGHSDFIVDGGADEAENA